MPWRNNRTPYRVWISEIMLQQTQVVTVIDYYHRWMKAYPNIKKLSDATEAELTVYWQGLGYYSRMKNILKTATIITERHSGIFPKEESDLLTLPGIGRYTAGAIRSFAFNLPAPIVDGNIKRIFYRYFNLDLTILNKPIEKKYWLLSEALIKQFTQKVTKSSDQPIPSYRDFNESLIELGATVCQVKPKCNICPLADKCKSLAKGKPTRLPKQKKILVKETSTLFIITQQQDKQPLQFLLFKRNHPTLLKGLNGTWEFPILEHHSDKNIRPLFQKSLVEKYLPNSKKPFTGKYRSITTTIQRYTKYQTKVGIYHTHLPSHTNFSLEFKTDYKWFNIDELNDIGLSSLNQKVRKICDGIVFKK